MHIKGIYINASVIPEKNNFGKITIETSKLLSSVGKEFPGTEVKQ